MRQLGKGTVFSGIAIRHKFTLVECYMNRQTEELKVSVNKIVKTVGQGLSEYNLAHVEVTESVTSEGIQMVRFEFQQNMMIVEVYAVGNLINLKLSVPPTFRNRTRGLMGTYDGDTENDYTAYGKSSCFEVLREFYDLCKISAILCKNLFTAIIEGKKLIIFR